MPQFIFQKYIDQEYEDKQLLVSELSDAVIKISTSLIRSDEEFISQIVFQSKTYANLILDLFDYIDNCKPDGANDNQNTPEKLLEILSPPVRKSKPKSGLGSARQSITDALINGDPSYLEQKIEYLNAQISRNRKLLDSKSIEAENFQLENARLSEKIECLNQTITQLKEKNLPQFAEMKTALHAAEVEAKALLEINFEFKDKCNELEAELITKRKEMIDLLEKIDPDYVEKLENEIERLKEQNEFSEKLEDIEKMKEVINEKDKQCASLQQELDLRSKESESSNSYPKHKEVARVVNRVIKEINQIMEKQGSLDGKLKEIPQEISAHEKDSQYLIDRINSKLIDISDSLRLVNDSLLQTKSNPKQNNSYRSPDKTSQEIGGVGIFSKVLESAQLLRDQIEEGADQALLVEQSKGLYQDLFILFQGLKHFDLGRRTGEVTPEVSNFTNSLYNCNATRSPSKIFVRETLFKVQEEVSGQLRQSVASLQVSNMNELSQQLQLQIERNNELGNKYESIQKAFHTVSLIINEEITRCLMSFDDVLSIASDNVLVLKLKRDLCNFRTQIGDLFARQGHYYVPQKNEIYNEFERQRTSWETSLNKQKDSFAEELKKAEQALRREENALKKEKEASVQVIAKLEGEVKALGHEKGQLSLEVEQLRELLADEEALSKDAQTRYQHDIDLQKKANICLEVQIHELQKFAKEKEKSLAESVNSITESANSIVELGNKCKELEAEVLKLLQEIELLQKDKTSLTEQLALNESTFRDIGKRAEIFEQQIKLLEQEREELQNSIGEKENIYEVDRDQLTENLERVQAEYKDFAEKTQKKSAELKKDYEEIIEDYTKQLEQVKSEADTSRIEREFELRSKRDEIRELNARYQALDDLCKLQEASIKKKDEKLNSLLEENHFLQEKTQSLDLITKEASRTQEKSKKYFELLTNTNSELGNLKSEFQLLNHEKKSEEQRLEALEEERRQRKEEVDELREKLARANQKSSESANELKTVKAQLEAEQQILARKEKQLKFLNETHAEQTRGVIEQKEDQIQKLKDEIKSLSGDHGNLRIQYQRLAERNEKMVLEMQSLKSVVKENQGTFKEMETLNKFNDDLLDEMKKMRGEIKKKDRELSTTKKKLKHGVQSSNKKLRDISNRFYGDESEQIKLSARKEKVSEIN